MNWIMDLIKEQICCYPMIWVLLRFYLNVYQKKETSVPVHLIFLFLILVGLKLLRQEALTQIVMLLTFSNGLDLKTLKKDSKRSSLQNKKEKLDKNC
jgi:hypothetical protein